MGEAWVVPLSDVVDDDELAGAARETVTSGWWSMGPRVARFERGFAALCGTLHVLAVENGTVALHAALVACGRGPGDEFVLPPLNFVAAANVVVHTGARPVFCDIVGPDDLKLDADGLAAAVSPAPLHYGGHPCNMDAVLLLAAERGFTVVEGAAHAPGATLDGRPCGSMEAVGCSSFFSNKNLPVGEGGMVVTGDDQLAERLRLLRSHGMTTPTWDRHRGHAHSYECRRPRVQLPARRPAGRDGARPATPARRGKPGARSHRRAAPIAARRRQGLCMPFGRPARGRPRPTTSRSCCRPMWHATGCQALAARRIQTSVHYAPIHSFMAYRALSGRPLPHTDAVAERILTLPLYPHLSNEHVPLVAEAFIAAVQEARPQAQAAG